MKADLILVPLLLLAGAAFAVPPISQIVQSLAPPTKGPSVQDERTVLQFGSDNGRRHFLSEHNGAFLRLSALIAGRNGQQAPDSFRLNQSTAVLLTNGEQRAEVQQRLDELDALLAKQLSTFTGQSNSAVSAGEEAESTLEFRRRLAKFAAVGAKCDDCHSRYTVVPR